MSSATPEESHGETLEGAPAASVESEPALEEQDAAELSSACVREVAVEIPTDVVTKEFDSVVGRYAKVARVPGFRAGKAPVSLIRTRFAGEIKSDVLESLVPKYFREAVIGQGFRPISEPHFHELTAVDGQPIRFKAVFEVMPDIELGKYQDIKVEDPEVKVTDEDVETELKRLQEQQSAYDPVEEDRPLQPGDFAQISFQASPKEAAAESPAENPEASAIEAAAAKANAGEPVKMDEVLVEIGGSDTVPEFTQNLQGMKPGGERSFDVSYTEDYYDKRLAGKTISYAVKINAIKKKTTPELTDEFAKSLGSDLQTVDDLRKYLREGMLSERQHRAQHERREKILTELTGSHEFPVPEILVRRQVDLRLERFLRGMAARGMQTEAMKRLDFKSLRAIQREPAIREVKANLLLHKIAEAENIQATDEEVNREIQAVAQQANQPFETVQQRLADEGAIERIRNGIRSDKALQFLYDQSKNGGENSAVQE